MTINIIHKDCTDEETYQKLLKLEGKDGFMDAEEWKEQRLEELKRKGLNWSK